MSRRRIIWAALLAVGLAFSVGEPGLAAPDGRAGSVEVSYDDGRTWHPAALSQDDNDWTATVNHPATAGYVSLRASASASAGNTVEQTIIHAYRLSTH